jgi:c-di-GMP-binding flagellar brake protein YcgR
MTGTTAVVLVDDGGLGSAVAVLEQLGVEFERVTPEAARSRVLNPERLLVTTGPLAHTLRLGRGPGPDVGRRAIWVAFVKGESKTQKALLQKAGFDFLVRDPVHPLALRVLLQRALFSGADSRGAPRVACGHGVTFKTGLFRRRATLVDLSLRGCRLLTGKALKEKAAITVQIPKDLAGGRALDLPGHVVRASPADREGGASAEHSVGIRFAPLEGDAKNRLRAVLAERVLGPAVLPGPIPVAGPVRPPDARPVETAAREAPPRQKRRTRRGRYERKITAMEGNESYMLLCRDLSSGGMRVEPVDGLEVGAKLDLAIQISAREEPFLVETTVVRDDGERGLALRFDWVAPDSQRRIQALVDSLPAIEGLQGDTGQGSIVAQRIARPGHGGDSR